VCALRPLAFSFDEPNAGIGPGSFSQAIGINASGQVKKYALMRARLRFKFGNALPEAIKASIAAMVNDAARR
jgi:hypothetical protein